MAPLLFNCNTLLAPDALLCATKILFSAALMFSICQLFSAYNKLQLPAFSINKESCFCTTILLLQRIALVIFPTLKPLIPLIFCHVEKLAKLLALLLAVFKPSLVAAKKILLFCVKENVAVWLPLLPIIQVSFVSYFFKSSTTIPKPVLKYAKPLLQYI